jgi:hypothetical protein
MPPSPHDEKPPHWLKAKVANLVWQLTPTCREVARLTSEEREHPRPLPTRLRLRVHRHFCTWCARYAKQLDLMHDASQFFPEHLDEIGGPALDSDARERMKRTLTTSGESPAADPENLA